MSFWDHLEDLRKSIIHVVLALVGTTVVLFLFKNLLFDGIILAPTHEEFWFYRLLAMDFSLSLVNLEVAAQFMIHMKVTFLLGLVVSFPYLIYEVWKFIAPALYDNEKKAVKGAFALSSGLFYLGVAVGYLIIFPVMLYFFANYQVSADIPNTFSLSSYISLLISTVLAFGIVFEFPTVIALLSALGIVTKEMLRGFRKHAVCVVLILAAIITPTGDPFSLLVCSIPIYILYELSILMCRSQNDIDK
jgi:sec-independent protein translocase protein TatC